MREKESSNHSFKAFRIQPNFSLIMKFYDKKGCVFFKSTNESYLIILHFLQIFFNHLILFYFDLFFDCVKFSKIKTRE